jgi:hypothetical protein
MGPLLSWVIVSGVAIGVIGLVRASLTEPSLICGRCGHKVEEHGYVYRDCAGCADCLVCADGGLGR